MKSSISDEWSNTYIYRSKTGILFWWMLDASCTAISVILLVPGHPAVDSLPLKYVNQFYYIPGSYFLKNVIVLFRNTIFQRCELLKLFFLNILFCIIKKFIYQISIIFRLFIFQEELYNLILETNKECVKLCEPGTSIRQIHNFSVWFQSIVIDVFSYNEVYPCIKFLVTCMHKRLTWLDMTCWY